MEIQYAICVASLMFALAGCGGESDSVADPEPPAPVEWHAVGWSGGVINVALVEPGPGAGTGPHPVVLALPWGSGTADLVLGLVQTYWDTEAPARGYYVVAPEVLGSSLATTADELIPDLFRWMDEELDYDPDRVVLTGASNGGRGVFFSAVARPERFAALIGMPGRYEGDGTDLAPLSGVPVWLLVGQFDDGWVEAAESTRGALEAAGVDVTLDVVQGQGHVLRLDQAFLMDWIDGALTR